MYLMTFMTARNSQFVKERTPFEYDVCGLFCSSDYTDIQVDLTAVAT